MEIIKMEIEKYKKFPTRYDLRYWNIDIELSLEVSSFEFEAEYEIQLIVKKLKEDNIESLIINTCNGCYQINLENLKYLTFLKELSIDSGSYVNIEYLYQLENLETLWLNNQNYGEEIDLRRFKKLKKLIVSGSCINLKGLFELPNLVTLKLQKFKETDLTKFAKMENLTALELVQPRITSLDGIEKMKNLKCLTIFYASKLLTLEKISVLKDLEYIEFDVCKKIENYNGLESLSNLKYLSISNCAALNDMKFVNNLHKLEEFGFVDTNVLDGDIEPLIKIKWHGYINKRNFNYYNKNGVDIKKER